MPRGRPRKVENETIEERLNDIKESVSNVKKEIVEDNTEEKLDNLEKKLSALEPVPYEDLIGKLIVARVGSDEKPATVEMLKEVENNLKSLLDDLDCRIFVTYHNVEIDIY